MNIVKKIALAFLLSITIISGLSAADKLKKITVGNSTAPVTIDLFYAITCGACAVFDKTILPELKNDYVDKGLVKINFIEAPYNNEDILFAYSLLHNTKDSDVFLVLLKAFFEDQQKWASSSSPKKIFKTYAQLIGMKNEDIEKIEKDKKLQTQILQESSKQLGLLNVTGTPTVIFTKTGTQPTASSARIVGLGKYSEIKKEIEKLLKK